MKKTKKIILLLCIFFVLIMATSMFISATNTIEDETIIVFNDKNLYDKVKNYFSGKTKLNTNEETLTIRDFTRVYKLNNRVGFSWR